MENMVFSRRSKTFKENKMKRVIFSKVPSISDSNVLQIVRAINMDKQYFVKVTRNPKKFVNTIAEEKVSTKEKNFESKCSHIYGDFTPGVFEDFYGQRRVVNGIVDEGKPAAAVKTIITTNPNSPDTFEYLLLIYEPVSLDSSCVGS